MKAGEQDGQKALVTEDRDGVPLRPPQQPTRPVLRPRTPGPDMMTSRNHGGFGPRSHGHGYGYGYGRIAPPLRNRDYSGRSIPHIRQRFTLGDDGLITLDPGDRPTVEIGEDGVATDSVASPEEEASEPTAPPTPPASPPAPEAPTQLPAAPPTPTEGARRGLYGRVVERMAVASNSDGSITVRPEGDASLQIVGDPLSGNHRRRDRPRAVERAPRTIEKIACCDEPGRA